MFQKFLLVFVFIYSAVVLAETDFEKEVLGACKAEVKDNCKMSKSNQSSLACLRQKSSDKKVKFTDDCRNKIADKKLK